MRETGEARETLSGSSLCIISCWKLQLSKHSRSPRVPAQINSKKCTATQRVKVWIRYILAVRGGIPVEYRAAAAIITKKNRIDNIAHPQFRNLNALDSCFTWKMELPEYWLNMFKYIARSN